MQYCLPAQIAQGRTEYLTYYHGLIDAARKAEPGVALELMLAIGDGNNPHGSRFNLPFRIDIATGPPTKPKLANAAIDKIPMFAPRQLLLPSGRSAQLRPFPWHECAIIFHGPIDHWDPVLRWFDQWFDRAETHQPDEHGLAGVVHSITEPATIESGVIITVDFGSAPIDAFENLVTTLDSMELREIQIGSFGAA